MISFSAKGRSARCVSYEPITSGSVGLPVAFSFSGEWKNLTKIATFKAGSVAADVALNGVECTVPTQVLAAANIGKELFIGVRGANGEGTTVIPTVWGSAGMIEEGAEPSGVDPSEPEPDWAAQVQEAAAEALEKATAVEEAADRGDFDGQDGAPGRDGQDGRDGTDGQDGVSPTVTVTEITGGHSVTITDAEHPSGHSFDVMDGQDGGGVPAGGTTGQVLKKRSGTDYDTEWADETGGGADIDLGITGASAGDMIKVAAVDGNDKPTAWAKAVAGTDYQPPVGIVRLTT